MVTQWPVFVELSALVDLDKIAIRRDIYSAKSCVYFQKYSSYPLQTWNSYSVSQGECNRGKNGNPVNRICGVIFEFYLKKKSLIL